MDRRRGNIVVSRRSVLEETRAEQRSEIVARLAGGPGDRRSGQEHHRLRRLHRSRRHRRPAARHRHGLAPRQSPVRDRQRRRHGEGADRPHQPGDAAHQPRHEAAAGRSVGRHRGQVSGRRALQGHRHEHRRLRRVRGAGAGRRGPDPRLRDELDQEERPSRQDRLHQPAGRGADPRGRSAASGASRSASSRPRTTRGRPSSPRIPKGTDGRGPDPQHHRVRPVRRPRWRRRRHGASVRPRLEHARATRPSRTTRRATTSKRWCSTSIRQKERICLGIKQVGGDPIETHRQAQEGRARSPARSSRCRTTASR